MAKQILDIFIEPAYSYTLNFNFDTSDGTNLEQDYNWFFESSSIGVKQFYIEELEYFDNEYKLVLSPTDTLKLTKNLEEYVIYSVELATNNYNKILSGRIHIDRKVRK